jgi:hypothetical protein
MPLVILHHLLNVSVLLANKRGFKKKLGFALYPSDYRIVATTLLFRDSIVAISYYFYDLSLKLFTC